VESLQIGRNFPFQNIQKKKSYISDEHRDLREAKVVNKWAQQFFICDISGKK
jgi:hypothetical protein